MIQILFAALILLNLTQTAAPETDVTCLYCYDVASPRVCRDTRICGQGEICYAREYTDQKGLKRFSLGCETESRCSLFLNAQQLFGKRESLSLDHSSQCYECCKGEKCNRNLCQRKSVTNVPVTPFSTVASPVSTFSQSKISPTTISPCVCSSQTTTSCPRCNSYCPIYPPYRASSGVACMKCQGVDSPEHCRRTSLCGTDEMCFTREHTDKQGLQSFNLGCESKTRCNLILNTTNLLGGCFDCCSSDQCNTDLCRGTTPPQAITPTAMRSCPSLYISYEDSCYFYANWEVFLDNATTYCKNNGGDLVSINTKAEQEFLVRFLKEKGNRDNVWTGGYYSPILHQWKWVDGTFVDYNNLMQGELCRMDVDDDYYIIFLQFSGGPWSLETYRAYRSYRFMCENQKK